MARPIQRGPGLWTVDGVLQNKFLPLGIRMTVIRLADGSLLIHSPIPTANSTFSDLDALGPVRWVIAPNKAHHLYVGDYLKVYPEAKLYGAPGLPEKRTNLKFDGVLSDVAPNAWSQDLEQHLFRGAPFLNEVLFFYKPTRTLIATDLVFNLKDESKGPLGMRLFLLGSGANNHFGPHRFIRFIIRDRAAARQSVDRIMQWNFDRIIMTHGEVLETGGRAKVAVAFAYLSGK